MRDRRLVSFLLSVAAALAVAFAAAWTIVRQGAVPPTSKAPAVAAPTAAAPAAEEAPAAEPPAAATIKTITWRTSTDRFVITTPGGWEPEQSDAGSVSLITFFRKEPAASFAIRLEDPEGISSGAKFPFATWMGNGGARTPVAGLVADAGTSVTISAAQATRRTETVGTEQNVAIYLELPDIYMKISYEAEGHAAAYEQALATLDLSPDAAALAAARVIP